VADCSDPKMQEHIEQTREVLAEIGAESVPYVIVYNKLDVNPDFTPPSVNSVPAFVVSALQSRGLAALKAELVVRASRPR
jgi:GTP-binding protein HflX